MKIEHINNIKELMAMYPNGTHAVFVDKQIAGEKAWMLSAEVLLELIRLAEIGVRYDPV